VLQCESTGDLFLIEGGARRKYSREAYAASGSPKVAFTESGVCARVFACPAGDPVPAAAA
jgi:hypothetical protein